MQSGCLGLQSGCLGLQDGCMGLQAGCVGLQAGCMVVGGWVRGHRVLCARVKESVEVRERAAQVAHLVRVRG